MILLYREQQGVEDAIAVYIAVTYVHPIKLCYSYSLMTNRIRGSHDSNLFHSHCDLRMFVARVLAKYEGAWEKGAMESNR